MKIFQIHFKFLIHTPRSYLHRVSNFRIICEPDSQSRHKFTIEQAESAYQPKIDENAVKLEQINDNCLLHIASYLNLIDIVNLSNTSIRMQSFSKLIFQKRTHLVFKRKSDDQDQSWRKKNLPKVLQAIGSYIRTIEWRGLNETHLQYLSQFCPNVTELKLVLPSRDLNSYAIKNHKEFFKNIEKLIISHASFFDATMKVITTASSKLKHLRLIKCQNILGKFFSNWNCQLVYLKISNCCDVHTLPIREIGPIRTLKYLSIDAIRIDADTIKRLGTYKNLKQLTLRNGTNTIKKKLYSSLPVQLPKLTKLVMKMENPAEKIKMKSVAEMISSLSDLNYFSHSSMSWQLLDMILQVRILRKQPPIEIGISKVLYSDPKKVN